jgi:hypothetical protein
MRIRSRKAILTGIVLVNLLVIISLVTQSFNHDEMPEARLIKTSGELNYHVGAFSIPDSLDFAGERMPLENFDTRESLDRELLVSAYRHSATIALIKRANRFFPVIEPILAEYGLPDDLKYIAVAESDLSNAVSPVGATGFWQIMQDTGREYGMEINQEVDERYDLEKSTHFACRYLLKAYEKYGSWTMAAAAYNAGNRGIDEQVKIQGEDNYYDLLLNEETARYIFRIASYKLIFSFPERYGITIGKDDLYPEIPYFEVKVDTAVTGFDQFAKSFGTNYKILKYLNPWLRRPNLTNRSGKEYIIKIPAPGARTITVSEEL